MTSVLYSERQTCLQRYMGSYQGYISWHCGPAKSLHYTWRDVHLPRVAILHLAQHCIHMQRQRAASSVSIYQIKLVNLHTNNAQKWA